MYKFGTTKRFDKALKLCKKRGYPIEELRKAIAILVENGSLPSEYKPHILHGNHEGEWEAHIKKIIFTRTSRETTRVYMSR
ncbi:type II toxin-antitoxin system YafQ family toxin [Leyella stercorea]|uniref:type II toxin-antitoxin system YafQ family toxin n=1 Tax=Leyella stercorea TaxID=363265 RepID=UPI003F7EA283